MTRVLCAFLPMWSVDLVRRRRPVGGHDPFILLHRTVADRQLVVQACEAAAATGVRPEMTVAQARALLPEGRDVHVQTHDADREAAALRALAVWAQRHFSPIVAVEPPDGLRLDITGCQRLFRGERPLLARFSHGVRRLGFHVHAAIASTGGCAWAMARYGAQGRVGAGRERAALAGLPVAALRVEADTVAALRELGVDRIGDLYALPRDALTCRFGDGLLRRLDQALGAADERLTPVRPVVPVTVERVFDGPVKQLEAVTLATQELVETLAAKLQRIEAGARRLELTAERVDAPDVRESITFSRPSRDPRHLWSLLRPRVETLHLGYGVEGLQLTAAATGGLAHEQATRWGAGDDGSGGDTAWGRFLDTLGERFGWSAAWHASLVQSHVPERAYRLDVARSTRTPQREPAPEPSPSPRPPRLLEQPEPIDIIALAPDGPPARMRWGDETTRIVESHGPERIAWEWWRDDPPGGRFHGTRDYWAVQNEHGRWLWIYRHLGTGGWFVQGEWG